MRTIILVMLFVVAVISSVQADLGLRTSGETPDVRYESPRNDSIVDLTGEEYLKFRWRSVPLPGGGRDAFRLEIFKGFEWERIYDKEVGRTVKSLKIPAEIFDDDAIYTWRVRQRDGATWTWSRGGDRWSFKVIKKKEAEIK